MDLVDSEDVELGQGEMMVEESVTVKAEQFHSVRRTLHGEILQRTVPFFDAPGKLLHALQL